MKKKMALGIFSPSMVRTGAPQDIAIAEQFFESWTQAVHDKNIDVVLSHYSQESSILLPTLSNLTRTDDQGRRNYFELFLSKNPKCTLIDGAVNRIDNLITYAGHYNFKTGEGLVCAKFTFNIICTPEGALVTTHHHSGLLPSKKL